MLQRKLKKRRSRQQQRLMKITTMKMRPSSSRSKMIKEPDSIDRCLSKKRRLLKSRLRRSKKPRRKKPP